MNTEFNSGDGLARPLTARLAGKFAGLSRKKALEYLVLFTVLTVIYYCYFVRDANANVCPTVVTITLAQLGVLMLKFLVFTSWPFAVMAALDSNWRSKDGGNVFLAAYIFTNVLWYHKTHCAFCIFASAMRIVPYAICACIAHAVGALRHRTREEE